MKVRVKARPTGTINGQPWPEVGDTIDLPQVVVEGMAEWVEPVKSKPDTEKKAAPKVEKRPAAAKGVETRVGPDAG